MRLEAAHVARLSFRLSEPPVIKPDRLNSLDCEMMGQMCSVVDVRVHAVEHNYDCSWLAKCRVSKSGQS